MLPLFQISSLKRCYVPTAPWTWVFSRQPVSGMGVKHLLPPLRPAWGSVWLGMKFSESPCDCTAKAHPPVSQLSSTKTQHSHSAVEETLGCSSMMARCQMRKQVETAFNKGYLSTSPTSQKHYQNDKPVCTDWNGYFNHNDHTMKTGCNFKTLYHCYLKYHLSRWCQDRDKVR